MRRLLIKDLQYFFEGKATDAQICDWINDEIFNIEAVSEPFNATAEIGDDGLIYINGDNDFLICIIEDIQPIILTK